MDLLRGYLRTIRQYLSTAKGKHDFWDDIRAVGGIVLTVVLLWLVVRFIL